MTEADYSGDYRITKIAGRAKLQPIDSDVVAAWKQEYVAGGTGINGMQLIDYSGNGYDGVVQNGVLTVPELVPERLSSLGWLTNFNSPPAPEQTYSAGGVQRGLSVPAHGPATEILGDLTFTTTLALSGHQGAFPAYQTIYAHGDDGAGLGTSFNISINLGGFEPVVYWDDVGGAGTSLIVFSSALGLRLRTFLYSFLAVVRNTAAKTLTVGIDGVYETLPYTQDPPAPNAGRYPHIGEPAAVAPIASVIGFCGPIPNPVIRNATRTIPQLEQIRKETMGL